MYQEIHIHPIGIAYVKGEETCIELNPALADGLLGLERFSHLDIYYWLHENDTPELRRTLQVHPRKNPANPLTGVFATRSPMRPNILAHSLCRLISVKGTTLLLEDLDARDGSPVIDIKGYFPPRIAEGTLRYPEWAPKETAP